MDFKDKILNYENMKSKANSILFEGSKGVLLTSVHSMIQHKKTGIKKNEPFTKAIALYVQEMTDCYSYIKFNETDIDSNSHKMDSFKKNLLNHIRNNDIKLVIDIHGASAHRDFDVEFGTLNNLTASFSTIEEFKEAFTENGINKIVMNSPFLGGGITRSIYGNTDIEVIQIEINYNYRDYNNHENIERLCNSIINFILQYTSK